MGLPVQSLFTLPGLQEVFDGLPRRLSRTDLPAPRHAGLLSRRVAQVTNVPARRPSRQSVHVGVTRPSHWVGSDARRHQTRWLVALPNPSRLGSAARRSPSSSGPADNSGLLILRASAGSSRRSSTRRPSSAGPSGDIGHRASAGESVELSTSGGGASCERSPLC